MRKDGIVSAEIAFSTDPGAGAKGLAGSAEEIRRALEEAGRACAEAAKARAPVRTGRVMMAASAGLGLTKEITSGAAAAAAPTPRADPSR